MIDTFTVYYIAYFVTIISAIWSLLIWNSANESFKPLFVYCLLSAFIESIYFVTFHFFNLNIDSSGYNIFVLLESFIWIWLFYNWRLFDKNKSIVYVIAASFLIGWIADFIYVGNISEVFTAFRLYYGFVLVILSINSINYQIVHDKKNPLKSSRFLICIGLIIMFTNKILLEASYMVFSSYSFDLLVIVSLIFKLILILALLWMPRKPRSSHLL